MIAELPLDIKLLENILRYAKIDYWCISITASSYNTLLFNNCWEALLKDGLEVVEIVDSKNVKTPISKLNILFGLIDISKKYPNKLGQYFGDNWDATTGDLLLQCAIYGKETWVW